MVDVCTGIFKNNRIAIDRNDRIVCRTGHVDHELARGIGILRIGHADVEYFLLKHRLGKILSRIQGFEQFRMDNGIFVTAILAQFQHPVLAFQNLNQPAVAFDGKNEIARIVLCIRIVRFQLSMNDLVTVFFQRFRTRRPAGQIRREIWPVIGTVDVNIQFLARDHIIRVPVVTDCQFNTCELEQFTCIQGIDPRTGFPSEASVKE